MSDDVDFANDIMERNVGIAILNARSQCKPALSAMGKCYNCDEPLAEGETFCDADCAEDFRKWGRP